MRSALTKRFWHSGGIMPTKLALYSEEAFTKANKTPGWVSGADGYDVGNSKLGTHFVHVMHVDEKGQPLYDQYVRTERGGGMFLPVDTEGRIGLMECWRMQTKDQEAFTASYPTIAWEALGRVSYEIPGGFASHGETGKQAASREAEEETGSQVVTQEFLGYCSGGNKSFEPQLTTLVWGLIDPSKKPVHAPDPNEKLLSKVKFFTLLEIRELQAMGKLYETGTLAAISYFMLKHPERLMGQFLELAKGRVAELVAAQTALTQLRAQSPEEAADCVQGCLAAMQEALPSVADGAKVVKEGGAFGNVVQDTEIVADKILGEAMRTYLREKPGVGCITVEGMSDLIVPGGAMVYRGDPLDGSLNRKRQHPRRSVGLPTSACVTAHADKDRVTFADIVAAGFLDYRSGDVLLSVRGDQGFVTTLNDHPVCTDSSATLDLGKYIVVAEMYYPENRELAARVFAGQKGWLRSPGSAAYEMTLVASGDIAAFFCDRQKQHELGAAYAIVKGAGGVVVNFDGEDLGSTPYVFSGVQTPVILAANQAIADELVSRIKRARSA